MWGCRGLCKEIATHADKEGDVSKAGKRETLVFVSFRFDLRGGEREGETEGGTASQGHV